MPEAGDRGKKNKLRVVVPGRRKLPLVTMHFAEPWKSQKKKQHPKHPNKQIPYLLWMRCGWLKHRSG